MCDVRWSLLWNVFRVHPCCSVDQWSLPFCGWIISYHESISQLMNIWVISIFWPLWIMLLWTWVYKICLNTCFFWVYTREGKSLGHKVILCLTEYVTSVTKKIWKRKRREAPSTWTLQILRITIIIYWAIILGQTFLMASLVAPTVKNLTSMQETRVRFLGGEDPPVKEMATHSSILAGRIPWTEEPGRLQSTGLQRVRHDWVTNRHSECFVSFSGFRDAESHRFSTLSANWSQEGLLRHRSLGFPSWDLDSVRQEQSLRFLTDSQGCWCWAALSMI